MQVIVIANALKSYGKMDISLQWMMSGLRPNQQIVSVLGSLTDSINERGAIIY